MKMKDSGIPWIGQIPEKWGKCFLKNSFNFEKGKNASLYTNEYLSDNKGEIPVYSGQTENNGIMGFVKDYDYFSTGCLFVTTVGAKAMTIKILKGKFCLSQNCLIMQEKKNININFWFYALQILFDYEKSVMCGIMQLSLRIEDLKKYAIFLPNKDTQQKIVEILDKNCGQIDELVRIEENEIEKLKEYKTSLITKVVTKGLDPNAKMKDSGIPWIGQIPQDWEVGRLKNVCVERNEILSSTTDYDYEFRYIDISSVSFEQGILQYQNMLFKNSPSRARKIVRKNDVIISMVRTYLKAITLIKDDNNVIVSTGFAVLKTYNSNPQYIEFFVKSNYFSYMVTINSNGISYPAINIENLLNIFLVIPDMQTQQQIVDYLDRRCEEIDNLIKIKQAKIEKLKEYKKSLIYQYVTGKKEIV